MKQIGSKGEDLAAEFLKDKSYRIIARNYKTPIGELDIIAKDGETLVFVEVKTRKSNSHGYGYEAVDRRKLAKLLRTAQAFLVQHNYTNSSYQFDIISILLSSETIDYYENITQ